MQAFRIALDDLPAWAVEQAVKAWLRGEVEGRSNVAFLPAPPQLRDLAKRAMAPVLAERRQLRTLLRAEVVEPLRLSKPECDRRASELRGLIDETAAQKRMSAAASG